MPTTERTQDSPKVKAAAAQPGAPSARAHGVLRGLAIALGLVLAATAIAAWLGVFVEDARIALALGAALVLLPGLLTVRLRDRPALVVDVLAIGWLSLATLFFGPLAGWLHDPLVTFSERAGGPGLAAVADFLTGAPEAPVDAGGVVERDALAEPADAEAARGADRDGGASAAEPADAEGAR